MKKNEHRKHVIFRMSAKARTAMERMAKRAGKTKTRIVEESILFYYTTGGKP